jgi:hypothetical protein
MTSEAAPSAEPGCPGCTGGGGKGACSPGIQQDPAGSRAELSYPGESGPQGPLNRYVVKPGAPWILRRFPTQHSPFMHVGS